MNDHVYKLGLDYPDGGKKRTGEISTLSRLKFDKAVLICLWMVALHTVNRTFIQKLDVFFKLH